MRVRRAAVTLLAVASLASCSSTGSGTGSATRSGAPAPNSSSGSSSGAVPGTSSGAGMAGIGMCAKFVQARTAMQGLARKFSDPASLGQAMAAYAAILTPLEQVAPAEIAPTIKDLISVVKGAEKMFTGPAHSDQAGMQALATRLPADGAKIQAYVTANCPTAAQRS